MTRVLKTDKKPIRSSKGGALPGPGPGRPKGMPNKTTALIKQAFTDAFFETGGMEGLAKWVKESKHNRAQFYSMILKIVPTAIEGNINGDLTISVKLPAALRADE